MVDIQGTIQPSSADEVTLFFRPWGQADFDSYSTMSRKIGPGADEQSFHFRIEHPLGFEDQLRIDPVRRAGEFRINEIEVRCRLRLRTDVSPPFYSVRDGGRSIALQRLAPMAEGDGRFRSGEDPNAVFRTGKPYQMASCRFLEVDALFEAEFDDTAQLYFLPRDVHMFSETNSVTHAVEGSKLQHVTFIAESASGFADELRLDPVRMPQVLRFVDVQVRCLKRTLRHRKEP
jgi:hypothetical protein